MIITMHNVSLQACVVKVADLLQGGHRLAAPHSSMSSSCPAWNAGKVLVHSLLCRVEVPWLGLEAVGQMHGESTMQLRLVKERLVAALGLGPVGVLLNQALINLPNGLLCCCLFKDGATQIQIVCCNHLHRTPAASVHP